MDDRTFWKLFLSWAILFLLIVAVSKLETEHFIKTQIEISDLKYRVNELEGWKTAHSKKWWKF